MGGAVSSGENNDELVDNLMEADYIKTPAVEHVFRAVDRAFYYTEPFKRSAYKDMAWKDGPLHMSAPCIYSEVMESLDLKPGHSFLNLGSGTGYLSTMAGLMLGRRGINHGVELYQEVVEYARMKLNVFLKTSPAVDLFDFCEPQFVVGNFLEIVPVAQRYDRIYVGVACQERGLEGTIDMLKLGGILVLPLNDSLVQITRVSSSRIELKSVLPVSFASVIPSKDPSVKTVKLPDWSPVRLTQMCRAEIRSVLRSAIRKSDLKSEVNSEDLENRKKKIKKRLNRKRRALYVAPRSDHRSFTDAAGNLVEVTSSDEETDELDSRAQQGCRHSQNNGMSSRIKIGSDSEERARAGPRQDQDSSDDDNSMETSHKDPSAAGAQTSNNTTVANGVVSPKSPDDEKAINESVNSDFNNSTSTASSSATPSTASRPTPNDAGEGQPQPEQGPSQRSQAILTRLERIRDLFRGSQRQHERLNGAPPMAPEHSYMNSLDTDEDEEGPSANNGNAEQVRSLEPEEQRIDEIPSPVPTSSSDSEGEEDRDIMAHAMILANEFRIRHLQGLNDDDSDSETSPNMDGDGDDVTLGTNLRREIALMEEVLSTLAPTHIQNTFSAELMKRIQGLPLPPALKKYLNYNRN